MGDSGTIEEVNGYDLGANEVIVPADPPAEESGSEDTTGNDD